MEERRKIINQFIDALEKIQEMPGIEIHIWEHANGSNTIRIQDHYSGQTEVAYVSGPCGDMPPRW